MGRHFLYLSIFLSVLLVRYLPAQHSSANPILYKNPVLYNCVTPDNSFRQLQPSNLGFIKPAHTELDIFPSDVHFPVMIIFVQFANDIGSDVDWWPVGSPPVYMNELLASYKKLPAWGNWWDTYSETNELISDYWLEQSRGNLHITGKAYSIILDYEYSYYQTHGGNRRINDDIYEKLNKTYTINWLDFDKWKIEALPTGFNFRFERDGYVDMIYKVHRSHAPKVGMPAGGMALLDWSESQGADFLIDPVNNIRINGDYYYYGSGLSMSPGYGGSEDDNTYFPYAPLTKTGVTSFSVHEHGHYIFGGGHTSYGKMSSAYGCDEALSPWEVIYLGYTIPRKVDYTISDFSLGDFSSRNQNDTGEVLEVPLFPPNNNEAFLIASRTKVSTYDRIMWGDTAHGDPYRVINPEYGKGIYIYHSPGGYGFFPAYVDQECADGLFKWTFAGYKHPDWSSVQEIEYYAGLEVSYDNDRSDGSKDCADGKSLLTWFSVGKLHDCLGCDGTDRVYTNNTDVWTSRGLQGDRWDAWNVGYNEVFSPYSSPSTKSWFGNSSGVFIWYHSVNNLTGRAGLKVFKADYNGMTEDSILAQTPPSKPMGVNAVFTECVNGYKYPKVYWLHNLEPDMINWTMPPFDKKFYNIYIAKSPSVNFAPSEYVYIETVNISKDSIPYFIDYNHPVSCYGGDTSVEVLRYKIAAVDAKGWQSVKSDFAAIICIAGTAADNHFNNTSPLSFGLKQNYPNPFNPVTMISYSVPFSGFVKISVYNVLGEEVEVLVNELKSSGIYKIEFDGSNLPSGVYFYVLEASGYKEAKKMVLIK